MKGLITVAVMITMFGLIAPASAGQPFEVRALFETDIVPLGNQLLDKGEVYIRESGNFKVEIEGAAPDTDYSVFLLFGDLGNPTVIELGDLFTEEEGEGALEGENLWCSEDLTGVTYAGNPWIEIRYSDGIVHYVSGFAIGSCPPE